MTKTAYRLSIVVVVLACGATYLLHDGDGKNLSNAAPGGSSGFAPFASRNMELLAHLPLADIGGGPSVLGSDIWGWVDQDSGRKFALMGLTNALSFIEVTDPANPVYLGKLDTHEAGQNRAWRDIKVYNDHAYIVADGGGNDQGIQVFDLSRLLSIDRPPVSFSETGHYDGFSRAHNIVINEDSPYAIVVGSNQENGGLNIIDISDQTNYVMNKVGGFAADGYTHDAQAVTYTGPDTPYQGKEVVFACNEDTLTVVDISVKSNPVLISRTSYPDSAYAHQGWLTDDHRYFFMDDELDERNSVKGPDGIFGTADDLDPYLPTQTRIWNVEDLDNPQYIGVYEGVEMTIDHNLYTKKHLMYQANYSSGIRVIDISDMSNIEEVGFFDTYTTDSDINFNGVWSVFPYFDDGTIVVSDRQGGLFVVKYLERIVPDAFSMVTGTSVAGGLPQLAASDDERVGMRPRFQQFRWQAVYTIEGTADLKIPGTIRLNVESHTTATVGTTQQRVEFFNFDSGSYQLVGVEPTTLTDSVTSYTLDGDLGAFVDDETNLVRARVTVQNDFQFWVFNFFRIFLPFQTAADQATWEIEP